eukprot:TRINITY_DN7329_c0_g1_i1.p2 TRINITY_DN7329_c0_g1~~TRINITY_DN7329_c0_g1_i1.p2  ORF type:complete len:108 (-),score=10.27 TRINITY_DN7329_c0_g1_i1:16-339(-)
MSLWIALAGVTAGAGIVVREAWRRYAAEAARSGLTRFRGGFYRTMTHSEARLILNVPKDAQRQQILQAHRNMMRINHPDAGGSAYLATKVNEAKEVLTVDPTKQMPH